MKMATEKIFILLILVAGSASALSVDESFWRRGVFPDDVEWPSPHRRRHLVSEPEKKTSENNYKVCETEECKKVAEEFLTSINKSVNPCDDFYEFSCGAWTTKNIPPSSAAWSRFMLFDNTLKSRLKGILDSPIERSDILPVRQAKKWYQSCMNIEALEQRGLGPIESILMQNGGWPITMDEEEWDPEANSWQNVERHYARLTGSYAFFKTTTIPPLEDSKFGYLVFRRPELTLNEQLPLSFRNYNGNDYEAYVQLVENAAQLFVKHNHANVPKERLMKEAKEIVEFEKELFELEVSDDDNEEIYFEELEELCENSTKSNADPKAKINMKKMVQELFDTVNIDIDPKTEVYFSNGPYIKELSDLLAKTPKRTIVNYIHWTFVGNMLIHTTEHVRNELLAFDKKEFGVKERRPRWFECVADMKMAHAAAYLFVDKYFKESTNAAALEMITNIRNELRDRIEKSNWLDEESKKITTDKLDSMNVLLGFPGWYKNSTAVINHYKGITIGAEYFENMLSYTRYENKMALKRYLTREDPEGSWMMDPITVNAVYGPQENLLNLPAVDFQAPLFTRNLPDAVNYGVAGVIIGHEMGHGFDDSSIEFSKYGNETELSQKILNSYYQSAQCFDDQFEEYYREVQSTGEANKKANKKSKVTPDTLARRTKDENIADTTGIQAVFQAFQKLNKEDLRLPGLEEYTAEQLFFMSFGAVWCEIETPLYAEKKKTLPDPHSPAKLRVIGSVSNTKDFARIFNCPKGSEMNPVDKCDIWKKSDKKSKEKKSILSRNGHRWATQWKH